MAQAFQPASRSAIELARMSAGERVLDVATGTGNAALLAQARRGGDRCRCRDAGHILNHNTGLVRTGRCGSLHDDLTAFATNRGDDSDGQHTLRLDYLLAVAHRTR